MEKNQLKLKSLEQILTEYKYTWAWLLAPKPPWPGDKTSGADVLDAMFEACPGLLEKVKCPVTQDISEVHNIIIYLNDVEEWSRQQVADWLETLDVKLEIKEQ